MSRIESLIAEVKKAQSEAQAVAVEPPAEKTESARIRGLIEAQRKAVKAAGTEVPVLLGGEEIVVAFSALTGEDWCDIVDHHPPRANVVRDETAGFNRATLPRDFPTDHVLVGGEEVSSDLWVEMLGVLDGKGRELISTALWGMQVLEPTRALDRARKERNDG
ncbi:hypothetical protein [Microbacterium sp. ZW T5_56]|uniref:hypothetical protein n=1 Tax=Microbacterium sp. ZW T5_56 TaxID=3378081 RepID=UPI003851FA0F